jgi:lysophospholipase L1-like esterase
MFRFITIFFLAFTFASADEPLVIWPPGPLAPPGVPVAIYPAPYDHWFQYFYEHVQKSKTIPVDLLFDGDSITDLWQTRGQQVWQQHYGALNAFDFGISADQVQNVLWRLHHGELDGLHPKLIVLMIGTNNTGGTSVDDIVAGIRNLAGEYRQRCPEAHLLLLGIFPRLAAADAPIRAKIAQINQQIAKLDDGKNVTFLDIGAKFLQPDGTLTAEIMPDFLHPSEKGYQIWADAIQPIVDQYCPKSAATKNAPTFPTPPLEQMTWPPSPWPPGVPATMIPTPQISWTFGLYEGRMAALQRNPPWDLVFDGDILTERWSIPEGGQAAWAAHYSSMKALNLGINGDQVQNVLWRVRNGQMAGQSPKLIVLMIGLNNAGQESKDVAAGIKLILNEYETRCPDSHVLLMGLLSCDRDPKSGLNVWINSVNQILATFDDGKRVTYLDMRSKFLRPDGTLMEDAMANVLTPKGYAIWADAIQSVIDKYCPKTTTK